MDLDLNEEQRMLGESAAALLARHSLSGKRGDAPEAGLPLRADVWNAAAELGLTALVVPEEHDGMGAGPAEVYAAVEAVGAAVAPEPLVDLAYLPSWLLASIGTDAQKAAWLPRIAAGEARVAVAHAEADRAWDVASGAPVGTVATASGDGASLSGTKVAVRFAASADAYLVTASDAATGTVGVYLVAADAAGVTRTDGRTVEWNTASTLTFDGAAAEPLSAGPAEPALRDAYARARIALAAEAVGLMTTGLRLTTEYLKSRKQFGVTLSRFQALVHRAADLYSTVELSTSMTLWATAMAEDGVDELPAIADDAFVFVADSARQVAEECVQLHGGIGVTYEAEIAHVAARLTAITQAYGGIVAVRHRALATDSPVTSPSALRDNAIAPEVFALG